MVLNKVVTVFQEADLALGPFVYNQERTRVAIFTHPIHMDSTVILSKKISTKKMQLKFLNIFTWELWISILSALIFICLASAVLRRIRPPKKSLWEANFMFYSTFMGQSLAILPKEAFLKTLFAFWLGFSTIIGLAFNCQILSSLVLAPEKNCDTLEDFVQSKMRPIVEMGAVIETFFSHSGNEIMKNVWSRIETEGERITISELQSEVTLRKLCAKTHVVITEKSSSTALVALLGKDHEDCELHVSQGPSISYLVLAMTMRRYLEEDFKNQIILKTSTLMQSGLVGKWLEEYTLNSTMRLNFAPSTELNAVPISAFQDTFISWFVGILISIICLLLEVMAKQCYFGNFCYCKKKKLSQGFVYFEK